MATHGYIPQHAGGYYPAAHQMYMQPQAGQQAGHQGFHGGYNFAQNQMMNPYNVQVMMQQQQQPTLQQQQQQALYSQQQQQHAAALQHQAQAQAAAMQQQQHHHHHQQQQQQHMGQGVGVGGAVGNQAAHQIAMTQQQQLAQQQQSQSLAFKFLTEMYNPETREAAMQEMAKIRDHEKDMGLFIWHSTGIMVILVEELISVYPLLNPLTLSMNASSRVSNALTLLQCVASHNDTRRRFLDSQMVNFLLPFLSNSSHNKALECARLTALGVIGGLVKNDDSSAIESLLQMEIVPVCLRIMESGSELCKTLATFVIQKILSAEKGLEYMCNAKYPARFTAVATVLKTMVSKDMKEPLTTRLLRLILRCYVNFTHNRAAKDALKTCLPDELRNNTHVQLIESDQTVKKVWRELLQALDDTGMQQQQQQFTR